MLLPSFVLLAAQARSDQASATLEAYLRTHAPAGPWIAVDAGRTVADAPQDLAAFDRKAVRVGELTAIVPRTMVVVPDLNGSAIDPAAAAPRRVRILGLMASLDETQRRKMADAGLGLGDLSREQRPIFESLLPRPFRWRSLALTDGRLDRKKDAHGALSDADRLKVRLRTFRTLQIEVPKLGTRSRYSMGAELPPGLKGRGEETWYQLDLGESVERNGANLREVVPNAPKPGDLRTASLSGTVSGPLRTTVGALLAGGRTPEILADRRVAGLAVSLSAGSFRRADLLQALALAVTGTYRPVGSAFVLASDLEGTAARWTRNQSWLAQSNGDALDAEVELYERLRATGGLQAVAFAKNDPLAPPRDFAASLDAIDPKTGQSPLVPVEELPAGMRGEIDRLKRAYPGDRDYAQVGLSTELNFHFTLPDGKDLMAEPPFSVGRTAQYAFSRAAFRARDAREAATPPMPPPAPFALKEGNAAALVVAAESAEEAEGASRLAETFGFGELWLETRRPEALRRAVDAAKRPVRLVVRPWTAPAGAAPADPDRTLLGETASALARRGEAAPPGMIWTAPTPGGRELLAPSDRAALAALEGLAALAQTPGLAGVALLDAAPPGYDGAGTSRGADANGFGYSGGQRLAFLRTFGLDPVDVLDPVRGLSALPRLPFFPIKEGADVPSGADLTRKDAEAWNRFRADANVKGVNGLVAALKGAALVFLPEGAPGRIDPNRATLREAPRPEELRRASSFLRRARGEGQIAALDLSGVPASKRAGLMGLLLKRRS